MGEGCDVETRMNDPAHRLAQLQDAGASKAALPLQELPDVARSNINFKLRQLALLTALAETGTLRGAAERIHVSQPGATRLLQELEAMVGEPLFMRNKGKMQVTPAGEMMISHAIALQNRMLNAYVETKRAATGNAGVLRLGIFGSLDPDFLSGSIDMLTTRLPKLQVSLSEAPQEFLPGAVRRGELDAAVGRLITSEVDSGLTRKVLYHERFYVVCSGDHELARAAGVTSLASLLDKRWVLPARSSFLRQKLDAHFADAYGHAPEVAIETSLSLLSCLSLLKGKYDVCVLASGVARFLARQGVVTILVDGIGDIESAVALMTDADAPFRPATRVLLEVMMQNIPQRQPQFR
jgi:DNA-binding transcriptional LysR family regulator